MDEESRRNAMARLRRAAGQAEGVRRMIEEERSIGDVLIQLAAVRAALGRVAALVLESHLQRAIEEAVSAEDEAARERAVAELLETFRRYCT